MVSKIIKKTPTKPSNKDRRTTRRRKKTPSKTCTNVSSIVITSIHNSVTACQHRLIKIFTKFAKIRTTPRRRKHGFHLLKKENLESNHVCRALFPNPTLPPTLFPSKKTIFLDLDETLIHSKTDPSTKNFDFIIHPRIEGEFMTFYVAKRPLVNDLLEALSMKFEIVVFTAGLKEYASLILDKIDTKGVISYRLYRDSCKDMGGKYVKDLSEIGRDLKNVVLVDDNPNAYVFQPENALPVHPFVGDLEDRELEKVIKFFDKVDEFDDVREALKVYKSEEKMKVVNN